MVNELKKLRAERPRRGQMFIVCDSARIENIIMKDIIYEKRQWKN